MSDLVVTVFCFEVLVLDCLMQCEHVYSNHGLYLLIVISDKSITDLCFESN